MRALLPRLTTALMLVASSAAGDERPFVVNAACGAEPSAGRQVCRVEIVPPNSERLTWGDLIVRRAPPEIEPLRSRVVFAVEPDKRRARAVLGLVTSSGATGEVVAEVRAVLCRGESCRPVTREVTLLVRP